MAKFGRPIMKKSTLKSAFILSSMALSIGFAHATSAKVTDFPLAPGDTVRIDILDDDKIPYDLPIAPDGTIQAPLLGAVQVEGLTISQALAELNKRYVDQKIFVVPKLGVSVATYR